MTEQQSAQKQNTSKISTLISILPLYEAVLFPKMVLPLVVQQSDSIKLVDQAMSEKRIIGLLLSKKKENIKNLKNDEDLAKIGTTALILKMAKVEDNRIQLLVQGLNRFKIIKFIKGDSYLQAKVKHLTDDEEKNNEIEALMTNIVSQFTKIVELSPGLPSEIGTMAGTINEPGILADMVVSTINSKISEKQKVLETLNIIKRLKEVTRLVNHQMEILELGNKIQSQVKGDMDKRQREYYLHQQMKAI